RPPVPEADVLDIRSRRPRRRRDVRVENGKLVAVVLEEPHLGIELELEPVRRLRRVAPWLVALGAAVAEDDYPTCLVRCLCARVLLERGANALADHHQSSRSIAASGSAASQKGAERYFQPPSARIATTTPSSSSAASRRATWTTPPAETPAKMPSSSSRARMPSTASVRDEQLPVELR